MAESIARRDASEVIEPFSAGLTPLGRIEAMTETTLTTNGYFSAGLHSKPLIFGALDGVDMVVNMSGVPSGSLFDDRVDVEDWYVEDPYGANPELYQRIFEEIRSRVRDLASRLSKRADNVKPNGTSNSRLGK